MVTFLEAAESVYSRFTTNWGDRTPVVFENEAFNAQGDAEWVRLSVRDVEEAQETLGQPGNRRFRRAAIVFLQIYAPENAGIASARTHAQVAAGIFRGTQFDGLDFAAVDIRATGPTGRWFQYLMEAPFNYEETL